MKFEIKLFCRINSTTIGTTHVDTIRKAAGAPSLPLEIIDANIDCQRTWRVPVSEDIARASGHFTAHNVTEGKLRPVDRPEWWELAPVIDRDPSTGAVTHAKMVWEFQPTRFLRDWEEAGFPDKM